MAEADVNGCKDTRSLCGQHRALDSCIPSCPKTTGLSGTIYNKSDGYFYLNVKKNGVQKESYTISTNINKSVRSHTHYKLTYGLSPGISDSTILQGLSGISKGVASADLWTQPDLWDECYKCDRSGANITTSLPHGSREFYLPVDGTFKLKGYHIGSVTAEGFQTDLLACSTNDATWILDTNASGNTGTPETHGTCIVDMLPNTYTINYYCVVPNNASTTNRSDTDTTAHSQSCIYDVKSNKWTANWVLKGYHLGTCWHTDSAAAGNAEVGTSGKWNNVVATDGGTYNVYAKMIPNTYKVKYKKNSPTGDASDVKGKCNDDSFTFDTAGNLNGTGYTCDGYKFVGWSTSSSRAASEFSSESSTYDGEGSISGTHDFNKSTTVLNLKGLSANNQTLNLYAVWEPLKYKVVFTKGNSGSISNTYGGNIETTAVYNQAVSLFNNTPQLPDTAQIGNPNFTSEGYYVSGWRVSSVIGTRDTSQDTTGACFDSGTGYWRDSAISSYRTVGNLCKPKSDDCVVTLEALWLPIQYKVSYNNDTTIPRDSSVDRGYKFSTESYVTDNKSFGETYYIENFDCNRSNKYGPSLFLGYCFSAGDRKKNPTYYVDGRSPAYVRYSPKTRGSYTNFDWSLTGVSADAVHSPANALKEVSHSEYFRWLNPGTIKAFPLYAVWDDCPGMEPRDVEQDFEFSKRDASSSHNGMGALVQSHSDLEWKLLHFNEDTVWDREDDTQVLKKDYKSYYLENFNLLDIGDMKNVTSYEVRYVLRDSNGNTYKTSRMLYSGTFVDIMLHDGSIGNFNHKQ